MRSDMVDPLRLSPDEAVRQRLHAATQFRIGLQVTPVAEPLDVERLRVVRVMSIKPVELPPGRPALASAPLAAAVRGRSDQALLLRAGELHPGSPVLLDDLTRQGPQSHVLRPTPFGLGSGRSSPPMPP